MTYPAGAVGQAPPGSSEHKDRPWFSCNYGVGPRQALQSGLLLLYSRGGRVAREAVAEDGQGAAPAREELGRAGLERGRATQDDTLV